MKNEVPKQFIHIHDKPIIVYTMEQFQNSPLIDAILVVTLANWVDFVWAYAKQFKITKLKWVAVGGATGQESIYNGLTILGQHEDLTDVIMVHDGNRPLVSQDVIADSLSVFQAHGSAVAAVPCMEAVFKSSDGASSNISIPREELYRTQTPHTYTLGKLLWAHEQARKRGINDAVASCTLMQSLGETVYLSKGTERNLKLTTEDDLEIFKACVIKE